MNGGHLLRIASLLLANAFAASKTWNFCICYIEPISFAAFRERCKALHDGTGRPGLFAFNRCFINMDATNTNLTVAIANCAYLAGWASMYGMRDGRLAITARAGFPNLTDAVVNVSNKHVFKCEKKMIGSWLHWPHSADGRRHCRHECQSRSVPLDRHAHQRDLAADRASDALTGA